jgi:hypothetical protein
VESEDEASIAEVRRIMIRMFNKLKEDIQKQLNEPQEQIDKKLEKTQKQLNEFKDVNLSKMKPRKL